MFKKDWTRRPAPRCFQEPAKEMPPNLADGFSQEENILVCELEETLNNLREAVRRGEAVAGKIAAAIAGDNDG